MGKDTKSSWEIRKNAEAFLDNEGDAVPGAELQLEVIGKIAELWCGDPFGILDLGCGDGVLGRFLLNKFPSASGVLVDISDAMLDAARDKLGGRPDAVILKADFSSPDWLGSVSAHRPFDIIVSGFAIHHQTDERKREIYSEIHDLLTPGGVFLNLEHVSSATHECGRLFEEFYADYLHRHMLQSDPGATREAALEIYGNRPDRDEDKTASVEEQCGWLRAIGFDDVDCFFKVFEIALFGGRRK